MRGRTALYGLRHLLQLVAIKRLQAKGYTLEQVQQALEGLEAGDKAEVEFPFTDTIAFHDLETDEKIQIDPATPKRKAILEREKQDTCHRQQDDLFIVCYSARSILTYFIAMSIIQQI